MRQILSVLLVVFAVIGLADASYLTYEKLSGEIPVCGDAFDCGSVINSKYGSVGSIPVSVFGMFYYLSVLSLAVLYMTEVRIETVVAKLSSSLEKNLNGIQIEDILVFFTSLGVLVSIVLISIMAFVLDSWCSYCLISAASSTTLFILSVITLNINRGNSFLANKINRGN
ncbi:MAG: vitamin K epoxide reductase family protein [Microgenomates group bacterium]